MKTNVIKQLKTLVFVCLISYLVAQPAMAGKSWDVTYQSLNQRWQPMLQHILSICDGPQINYRYLRECAETLSSVATQQPLRLYSASTDHAVALGIEYRIGRAAPLRIYQVYEFEYKNRSIDPGFAQRKPVKRYMAVKFADHSATTWTSLSYSYRGRFFLASQQYLDYLSEGQGDSRLAHSEIERLLKVRDLDYHLKWGGEPALGWDLEQLDWMAFLLQKVKPGAMEPLF